MTATAAAVQYGTAAARRASCIVHYIYAHASDPPRARGAKQGGKKAAQGHAQLDRLDAARSSWRHVRRGGCEQMMPMAPLDTAVSRPTISHHPRGRRLGCSQVHPAPTAPHLERARRGLPKQKREVDPPVLVAIGEAKPVRSVDERRIEDHTTIARVGHDPSVRSVPRDQLIEHVLLTATPLAVQQIITANVLVHDQAASLLRKRHPFLNFSHVCPEPVLAKDHFPWDNTLRKNELPHRIKIGFARREPQIDVDCSGISMDLHSLQAAVVLVSPNLLQLVRPDHPRQYRSDLLCHLHQQWLVEASEVVRANVASLVSWPALPTRLISVRLEDLCLRPKPECRLQAPVRTLTMQCNNERDNPSRYLISSYLGGSVGLENCVSIAAGHFIVRRSRKTRLAYISYSRSSVCSSSRSSITTKLREEAFRFKFLIFVPSLAWQMIIFS
jgi:hypothetical protein